MPGREFERKFPFPECWENDVRMDVLFAPFRPRNVNPENYDSKLNFWKGMIEKYCEFKGSCDFSKSQLANAFTRKNKVPYGLQTVIDEMILSKEIRTKSDFLNDPLNTWTQWAVNNFVKKPLIWSMHLLSQGGHENTDPTFVHLGILQKQSELLHLRLQEYCGKVLLFEKISNMEKNELNNEGLFICLQYLHFLKKLHLHQESGDKQTILIKVPNVHEIATPLTEVDRAIYNLENLQDKVWKNLEDIETELKLNDDKIKQYIHEGKRSMAKSYLRRKHLLEARIEKKHKSLDNIHSLLAQVQEAQTHGEILDAYKIGSNTLKTLLSKPEMSLDSVDEVVANVKEAMDVHDEIQQSIGSTINDSVEDLALEEELNEILSLEEQNSNKEAISTEVDSLIKKKDKDTEKETEQEKALLEQLVKLEIETTSPLKSTTTAKKLQTS